jgi:hypothetical protein
LKVAAGLYVLASLWLLYDGYRALVVHVSGVAVSFAFHFALLVVPTTLMGLSLPLLGRGVVQATGDIAPRISRLYAANTLGAAAGAARCLVPVGPPRRVLPPGPLRRGGRPGPGGARE